MRLIDPMDSTVAQDLTACINAEVVRDGLATVDRRCCRYLESYPVVIKKLRDCITDAKRERSGIIEFESIEEDER